MSETNFQKQTKFEQLISVANKTKESLVRNWKENGGCFIDKDKMTTPGIIAEVTGLTSLLLFLVAFNEEKDIIEESDRETIREIHRVSFSKICAWVKEDGFTAEPLVPKKTSSGIFSKEKSLGYIDTITWTLSMAILTRYLDRKHILTMDIELLEKNYDLLADALGAIISSQRDDGTWGFLSDKGSEKSLYFTFVSNAAIADFFDYIMGEIAYLDLPEDATEEETNAAIEAAKDEELLRYLEKKFRDSSVELIDDSIERTMEEVRRKIQDWLVFDCLPLMPELSLCSDKNQEGKKSILGMWPDPAAGRYEAYFNLYYTYYLIEMMVTSGSDKRIHEIIGSNGANSEGVARLKESYKANDLMKASDMTYYFAPENIDSFWKNIMEQSIHSSRTAYMNVSRTGKNFWDSEDSMKSSLKIRWNHSNHTIQEEVENIEHSISNCTDPCIIPMALRSNVMYCYYISEQSDMTVDRLFGNICDQIATEDTENLFEGLWDSINFSLTVTERSVEALVDYYDFLKKFDKSTIVNSVSVEAHKSQIDLLIEEKIANYLKTSEAKSIIDGYVSTRLEESNTTINDNNPCPSLDNAIEQYLKTAKGEEIIKNAVGVKDLNKMYDMFDELNNRSEINIDTVVNIMDVIISAVAVDEHLKSRVGEAANIIDTLRLKKRISDVLKSKEISVDDEDKVRTEMMAELEDLCAYLIEMYANTDSAGRRRLREIMAGLYF